MQASLSSIQANLTSLLQANLTSLQANLTSLLHNTTVFLPSSQAVQEWLGSSGAEGYAPANTVYRSPEALACRGVAALIVFLPSY